jgi:hypothetical protein
MAVINELKQKESRAILEGLAMMTYNPSIGRVLEKGGVDKFTKIISENIGELGNISNQGEFDALHNTIVDSIKKELRTNRGETISYGQAQKPINVFLKVFVDWANLPSLEKASEMKKFLHVPLDSVLMGAIKDKFPNEYTLHVVNSYDSICNGLKKKLQENGETVKDSVLKKMVNPSDFSLNGILFKEMYYAWQNCLRSIHPEKPVLLDVFWSLNRRGTENIY